jgi:hypothetical protein
MFVIHPYKSEGIWAFDDAARGLVREPFVFGIPEMIERFTGEISDAQSGFNLYFSTRPFPGYHAKLVWLRQEYDGNWYGLEGTRDTGWLCPALLKFFDTAPDEIYCRVEPKAVPAGAMP